MQYFVYSSVVAVGYDVGQNILAGNDFTKQSLVAEVDNAGRGVAITEYVEFAIVISAVI